MHTPTAAPEMSRFGMTGGGKRFSWLRDTLAEEHNLVSTDLQTGQVPDEADLLLLDYIQRIPPPGEHGDRRGAIDKTMDYLRQFADAGVAVVVVAAVARTKDTKGRSSYSGDGLNLASFRESSELEFGADDAFILVPDKDGDTVTLRHLKARHTEPADIALRFDRAHQSFTTTRGSKPKDSKRLQSALAALWDRTPPASEDDEGNWDE